MQASARFPVGSQDALNWGVLELQQSWPHWMVTHTGSALYGCSLRVLFTGTLLGRFIRAIYSEPLYSLFLSIYIGPVARQVNDDQAIQSILCCTLHHYSIQVISIKTTRRTLCLGRNQGLAGPYTSDCRVVA